MSEKLWCLKCKSELSGGENSMSIFGVGEASRAYCTNYKCPRYGLITVFYLKEQSKAPETAKPNQPRKED